MPRMYMLQYFDERTRPASASRRNYSRESVATDAPTPCRASRGLCLFCRAAATEDAGALFCKAASFLLRVRRAPPHGACSGPVLASYLVGHIFLYCLRPSFYAGAFAELQYRERRVEQLQYRGRGGRHTRLAALRRRRRAPRAPGRAARRGSREALRREGAHDAPLAPALVAAHGARRRAARRGCRRRRPRHTPRAQDAGRARVFRRRARSAIRRAVASARRRARGDGYARRRSG